MKTAFTDRDILWMLAAALSAAGAVIILMPADAPGWIKTLFVSVWLLSALLGTVLAIAAAITKDRDLGKSDAGE